VSDPEFSEKVIADFVKPIYLSVHMNRPLDHVQALLVSELARAASADEILWMLGTRWRPRRVGAWFTLVHSETTLGPALLESLRTSRGYLTAPDLGFAAARRLGEEALPALHEYQSTALRDGLGGLSMITALIESLGGSSDLAPSTDEDHEALANRQTWADFIETA
jgi:hypothetical protein